MNLYRQLQDLLPQRPLGVAVVVATLSDRHATVVAWPGGSQQTVRGEGYATDSSVFVRDGVIEGQAPSLTAITIEV